MKIGIFCSASENLDPIYYEKVSQLGKWIGKNHHSIIYGGTSQGLMETIARSVNEAGGETIGIMPRFMYENGLASSIAHDLILTEDMVERKNKMMEKGDIFLALPGGFGTLDEIFHIIACGQVGYHQKKVVLYNINDFYGYLIKQVNKAFEDRFTPYEYKKCLIPVNNYEECIKELSLEK